MKLLRELLLEKTEEYEAKKQGPIPNGWVVALTLWFIPVALEYAFFRSPPMESYSMVWQMLQLVYLLGGLIAGVFYLRFLGVYNERNVFGRYEWIYVMPDEGIVQKPSYDDEAFRKADRIYRMKVGGWFRVSRQMMTPFEGKRIDHVRYDGDGDMTITLPHAKFTVPVSVAMQYIGWFGVGGSDFGATLDSLLCQVKGLRRLSEENRQEVTILENHLRGLLCCLRGDGKDRPAKWITKLRDGIISTLREQLPQSSNLRRESMIAGEDPNPNLGDVLAASTTGEAEQEEAPTSKS